MTRSNLFATAVIAVVGLTALSSAITVAQAPKDAKTAEKQEFKLPPGWTEEDVQAMMAAATPGKMHDHLAKDVGTWDGKSTMWMAPGAEPMKSESKATITKMLDGRFTKVEVEGDMPGMGPFVTIGIVGFDNVSKKFVANWIDNHGTGMMNGTGQLSEDGKTLTWEFTGNCPVTHKPITMREVDTVTGPNTRTLEMFGTPPKGGDEFKMMSIEMTRE
jgi:hypothetical protein